MTTSNMGLTVPTVSVTAGPEYATEINDDLDIIDAHDHTDGKGARITVDAINITNDLTFNDNNATDLRTIRLYNQSDFTPGVSDLTCLYALDGELHYIDADGNDVQLTLDGQIDLSTLGSLTLDDDQFTLQFFGDTTKKAQFSCVNVTSGTERIYVLPNASATDVLVSNTSTSTMTNKTLTVPVISSINTSGFTMVLPTVLPTSGQVLAAIDNTGTTSFVSSPTTYSELTVASAGTPFNTLTSGATLVAITGTTAATINGITPGVAGQYITILNNTNTTLTLTMGSGSAVAQGQMLSNTKTGIALDVGGTCSFQYDTYTSPAYWRLLSNTPSTQVVNTALTPFNSLSSSSPFILLNGLTASPIINGIAAGDNGQQITLFNDATYPIQLTYNSGLAISAARIITPNFTNYTLPFGSGVSLTYYEEWFVNVPSSIPGDLSGGAAPQFQVGQVIEDYVTPAGISIADNTATDLVSIPLTPGNYDIYIDSCVSGAVGIGTWFSYQTTITTVSANISGILGKTSMITSTVGGLPSGVGYCGLSLMANVLVTTDTIYYLVAKQVSGISLTANGGIFARRRA